MFIPIKTKNFQILEAKEDIICFKFTTKFCSEFKFQEEELTNNNLYYKRDKVRNLNIITEKSKFSDKDTIIKQGYVSFLNYEYFYNKNEEICLCSYLKDKSQNIFTKFKKNIFGYEYEQLCQEETIKIGRFKIPKGSKYIITNTGKVISNSIYYTGEYDILTSNPIIDNRIINDKTFALRLIHFIQKIDVCDCASDEEKNYLLNIAKKLLKHQVLTAKEQSEKSYFQLNKESINKIIFLE